MHKLFEILLKANFKLEHFNDTEKLDSIYSEFAFDKN